MDLLSSLPQGDLPTVHSRYTRRSRRNIGAALVSPLGGFHPYL